MAIGAKLRFSVLKRDGFKCFYCHNDQDKLQMDHVFPSSLGGTDTADNLVAACPRCNNGKSASLLTDPDVETAKRKHMEWQSAICLSAEVIKDETPKLFAFHAKRYDTFLDAWLNVAQHFVEDPQALLPPGWPIMVEGWAANGVRHAYAGPIVTCAFAEVGPVDAFTYVSAAFWKLSGEIENTAVGLMGKAVFRDFTDHMLERFIETYRDPLRAG